MEEQKKNEVHSAGTGRERSGAELKNIQEHEKIGQEQKNSEEETLTALKEVAGADTDIDQKNMPSTTANADADTVGPGPDINSGNMEKKEEEVIK